MHLCGGQASLVSVGRGGVLLVSKADDTAAFLSFLCEQPPFSVLSVIEKRLLLALALWSRATFDAHDCSHWNRSSVCGRAHLCCC